MGKFTRSNARYYGRKGGIAETHKKSPARLEREAAAAAREAQAESAAFQRFEQAKSGYFDGFEMPNLFHDRVKKEDALSVAISDDCATAQGVHVGADGVTVYFYCKPEQTKKQVAFNRSVYVFGTGPLPGSKPKKAKK